MFLNGLCVRANITTACNNLHAVLALNPAGHMSAPGKRTAERSQDKVPVDPRTRGNGTRLLDQLFRLGDRNGASGQKDKGKNTKDTRRHLGHDGSKNAGRRVFTFPVGVFGVQDQSRRLLESRRSTDLRSGGNKGLHRHGEKSTKEESELGHDDDDDVGSIR